jgi:hypothetical protein
MPIAMQGHSCCNLIWRGLTSVLIWPAEVLLEGCCEIAHKKKRTLVSGREPTHVLSCLLVGFICFALSKASNCLVCWWLDTEGKIWQMGCPEPYIGWQGIRVGAAMCHAYVSRHTIDLNKGLT